MKKYFFIIASIFTYFQAFASTLPQANLHIYPSVGEVHSKFILDASESLNTNDRKGGLQYRFKIDHNTKWTSWRGPIYKFEAKNTGTFRAQMETKDSLGRKTQTYRNYKVRMNYRPQARIKVHNPNALVGESVFFELLTTMPYGANQYAVKSRWDFNSDGKYETPFSTQRVVSYVFSKPDKYQPTIEIKWSNGQKEIISGIQTVPSEYFYSRQNIHKIDQQKVSIQSNALNAPIVTTTPGFKNLQEGTSVWFDASQTKLPQNGWIEWNFDSTDKKKGKKVTHQFNIPGKHLIQARACYRQSHPVCKTSQFTITIKPRPIDYRTTLTVQRLSHQSNQPHNLNPFITSPGDCFSLTVNSRSEGNVYRYQYRWDFEGDGRWDTPFSGRTSWSHCYPQIGNYNPKIEVLNSSITQMPKLVSTNQKIIVRKNTVPFGYFTTKSNQLYVGKTVQFHADGKDNENKNSFLKYRWRWTLGYKF